MNPAVPAAGLSILSLMLIVLIWQQADSLAVSMDEHCQTADGEVFISVTDGLSAIPYDVVEPPAGDTACAVKDSSGWTETNSVWGISGTPVAVETLRDTLLSPAASSTTTDQLLSDTTWEQPPAFVASPSQFFLAELPQLLFGILTFAALCTVTMRYWLSR